MDLAVRRFRAGIVGYGYTGRLHHIAYERAGGEVIAVADPNPRVEVPASVERFASMEDLLALDVDGISLCVPNALHCDLTIAALRAGKHVLLEKPIAVDPEQARRMIAEADRCRRTLFVGMTHRFYPELIAARAAVANGEIGEVVAITDCIYEHFGFLDSPRWYLDRAMAGGGTVLSSGIHLVDRVLWFAGDRVTAAWGSASNPFFGQDVEDCAQMSLRFASGVSAQIAFGLLREPAPLTCRLTVIGTRGMIVADTWKGWQIHSAGRSEVHDIYTDESHQHKVLVGMQREITEFLEAIEQERPPSPPASESLRALEVVAAFYRAAESQRVEEVTI